MSSTSDRLESLFAAAIELPPGTRSDFIDQECRHDGALRQRLEGLLRAHEASSHPIDQPAFNQALEATQAVEQTDAGSIIAGRYKLLEQIGEGGMGTVWVAEQREPVQRKVALKLIKPGMDSKTVLARFEAERQALALMDHPNIAKVLDGGLTAAERPYFVMEYVKGVPINEYCDQLKLSVPDRLKLFVQVCSAVQHAHQKGIIHRDLKPSNILVAPYDDRPIPKVIDFGLAKALHQQLTERTLHTAHETVLGTPLYMSPEQAQFNNLDVDTRADVYSLGVLLYELLTGTTPLEKSRFKEAAWDEIRRVIREEEPPRPSTRLSSQKTLPKLAACRQVEPVKLTQQLRGELDWVVMKALEKDRTRRYETATGLANDIERYLDGGAVQACPPTFAYRARKFVSRHRLQVTVGGLLLASLVVAAAGTSFGLVRAEQERKVAVANQRQAEAVIERTFQLLDDATSQEMGIAVTTQRTISAEQRRFYTEILKYYEELAGAGGNKEKDRKRFADAALRVGDLKSALGADAEAIASYQKAIAKFQELANDYPGNPDYRFVLATCYRKVSLEWTVSDNVREMAEAAERSHEILETLCEEYPDKPEYRLGLVRSIFWLALSWDWEQSEWDLEVVKTGVVLAEQLTVDYPNEPKYRRQLGNLQFASAQAAYRQGDDQTAMRWLERAIDSIRPLVKDPDSGPEDRRTLATLATILLSASEAFMDHARLADAERVAREAIELSKQLTSGFPGIYHHRMRLAYAHDNLRSVLWYTGRDHRALQHAHDARKIMEALLVEAPGNVDTIDALSNLYVAIGLMTQRLTTDRDEIRASLDWFDRSLELLTSSLASGQSPSRIELLSALYAARAKTYESLGDFDRAQADWRQAIDLNPAGFGPSMQVGLIASKLQSSDLGLDEAIDEIEQIQPSDRPLPWNWLSSEIARFYVIAAGLHEERQEELMGKAVETIRASLDRGFARHLGVVRDPVFAPLRARPEFQELLVRMGFERDEVGEVANEIESSSVAESP